TEAARRAWQYLRANGGNRAGMAIAAVDWNGGVHPDQFSLNINLGNIREEPFSSIWSDAGHPVLAMLRDRKRHLKGRCRKCVFIDICNGNLRARAEAATGDLWGEDPACYLTDEEIESRMLPFFETMR
ncbi:MAG: SPASM domain-containing protein, partial [Moorella sp. (in: Bacteria)]|nr:SPASM domain-containing protein [Moorella sp. (in: firmicutes)]